jgi:hypothetical protein
VVDGVVNAITHPGDTLRAIGQDLTRSFNNLTSSDPNVQGQEVGRIAVDVAIGAATDGAGKVIQSTKVLESAGLLGAKLADKATDLSRAVDGVGGKLDDVVGIRPIRWNAANGPGPLGETVAKTFRGASYTERVTTEPIKLYRVYGGEASRISDYWTKTKPSGPVQATIDSSLDPLWGNTKQKWVEVTLPRGTKIFEGASASIRNPSSGVNLSGGGNQIFIPNSKNKIPDGLITNQGEF